MVPNSADLTYCQGLPHGSACDVRCADGFARADGADLAFCQDGRWHVQGECLQEDAEVVQSAAVQVVLEVALDLPEANNYSSSLLWAQAHEDELYWAFARTLSVHPSELRLELLPEVGSARRLRGTALTFAVRLTELLSSALDMESAAQKLQSLDGAQEMEAFGGALAEELYGESGNISAIATVASVAAIDRYVLPAPSWRVEWDDSACAACSGGQSIGQVFCSRGPWLACEGPNSPAGPRPSRTRDCPPCRSQSDPLVVAGGGGIQSGSVQLPIWFAALLSLCAGIGCCGSAACGIFLAWRCPRYMKRVEPDEPPALFFPQECEHVPTERSVGSLFQRARFLSLPVHSCWTDLVDRSKSRKSSGEFSDVEPGLLQHISTMQTVGSSKSEEESDMARRSTMFVQRDSTDVSGSQAAAPQPPKGDSSPMRPRSGTLLDRVDLK